MNNKIRTLIKKVDHWSYEDVVVEDTLEVWESIVHGPIEVFPIVDDIAVVLNKDGELIGLDDNVYLRYYDTTLVGDVAFVGYNSDTESFKSIDDAGIAYLEYVGILRK